MNTNVLFNDVMMLIWESHAEGEPITTEAKAIVSYIKNHRVNAENALEVLNIMWPGAKMHVRPAGEGVTQDDPGDVWFDVQFADKSQVLLMARRGIGSAIEVL